MNEFGAPGYLGNYLGEIPDEASTPVIRQGYQTPFRQVYIQPTWAGPEPETTSYWKKPVSYLWLAANVTAMVLSYRRNRSIPWAFASGLVAPVYLAYRASEKVFPG